jgi:hypothetical protein
MLTKKIIKYQNNYFNLYFFFFSQLDSLHFNQLKYNKFNLIKAFNYFFNFSAINQGKIINQKI